MAKFSKAHYKILAKVISETRVAEWDSLEHGCPLDALGELEENLIRIFLPDNPKFNPARFKLACQPKFEVKR